MITALHSQCKPTIDVRSRFSSHTSTFFNLLQLYILCFIYWIPSNWYYVAAIQNAKWIKAANDAYMWNYGWKTIIPHLMELWMLSSVTVRVTWSAISTHVWSYVWHAYKVYVVCIDHRRPVKQVNKLTHPSSGTGDTCIHNKAADFRKKV